MRARLWISDPDGIHNNHGLQIYNEEDLDKVVEFDRLCNEMFPHDEFGTFHQGGHSNKEWSYFEFWKSATPGVLEQIIEKAAEISVHLNMPLERGDSF